IEKPKEEMNWRAKPDSVPPPVPSMAAAAGGLANDRLPISRGPYGAAGPKREGPAPSVADAVSDWRRAPPPELKPSAPLPPMKDRAPYTGRYSEGRPRMDEPPDSRGPPPSSR